MKKIILSCLFSVVIITLSVFINEVSKASSTIVISAVIPGVCGNSILEVGEQCDGVALGGQSCQTLGFNTGTLSCGLSCTFNTSSCANNPPPTGGGGGGGGGGFSGDVTITSVTFSGRAFPNSNVTILKDGQLSLTTVAGPDAHFEGTLTGLSAGLYNFVVAGEDNDGLRSSLFAYPVLITEGSNTKISGIFLSPTISTDKAQVKKGDIITIFGKSVPSSSITVTINSEVEIIRKVTTTADGVYLYSLESDILEKGVHSTKSRSAYVGEFSSISNLVNFTVGDTNIPRTKTNIIKGDLNKDGRVNIFDFSIAAFWYKKTLNADLLQRESIHLNDDGKLDIIDLSLMAYHWTG